MTIKKNVGESLCGSIKENWGAKSHWEKYIKIFFKWWKRRWTETQVLHDNLHVKGNKYKFEIIIEFIYFYRRGYLQYNQPSK